jgi:cellulose synthase/poly-beta-1,6-N-acetylglucosamine synthase-like glycosyltransferase
VYRSTLYPHLRVIDKANGGKADSINAGINAARYPIFCVIDADSVLQRDSLRRAIQPFLDDSATVAAGGTIRIANGCRVSGGFMQEIGLPRHPLAMFQIVEYLRAFLFGRLGWSPMNALLIVSGAFGLFRKEAVVAAGGFRADTIGEDMELIVRMHRVLREQHRPYRICYVPDPICWTEAPEDLRTLGRQRVRWQRGLIESLRLNASLCLNPSAGAAGMIAFPFFLFFECLGPIVEVGGFIVLLLAALAGVLSLEAFLVLTGLSIVLGVLLSTSAFVFEQMSFHVYPRLAQTLRLFAFAVLENLGYRQLNSLWRVYGVFQHLRGRPAKWGEMTRLGSWHRPH